MENTQEQAPTLLRDALTQNTVRRISTENLDEAFTYQPWDAAQQQAGELVRSMLKAAAQVICDVVPDTPLRTRALNDLIDARMKCNAAITFKGKF